MPTSSQGKKTKSSLIFFQFAFLAFFAVSLNRPVFARESASALFAQGVALAKHKKYDSALKNLNKAEILSPHDVDIKLAIARTLIWQGRNAAAQEKLDKIDASQNANADLMLLRASLFYYNKEYAAAEKLFQKILKAHPQYADARDGLERVHKAQKNPVQVAQNAKAKPQKHEQTIALSNPTSRNEREKPQLSIVQQQAPSEPPPFKWQVDAGYEYSSFERVPQAAWNQEFLQLTHFLDNGTTALHASVTRYEQFSNSDAQYEIGIDQKFSRSAYGYLYATVAPDSDFRPDYQILGGFSAEVLDKTQLATPLWFTFDSLYSDYGFVHVGTLKPGARLELGNNWAVSGKLISIVHDNTTPTYGWEARLDGGITDQLTFYAGLSDAPETESGITVSTRSYFGGLAYAIDDARTVRVGYAHEDRDNSYIRHVINASFSVRF